MTRAESKVRKGRSGSWCPKPKRWAIYIRDNFRCAYCGCDLTEASPYAMTLDHLVCRVNGANHHETNLVLACVACNSGRGARVAWHKYATPGAVKRIRNSIRRRLNRELAKQLLSGQVTREQILLGRF